MGPSVGTDDPPGALILLAEQLEVGVLAHPPEGGADGQQVRCSSVETWVILGKFGLAEVRLELLRIGPVVGLEDLEEHGPLVKHLLHVVLVSIRQRAPQPVARTVTGQVRCAVSGQLRRGMRCLCGHLLVALIGLIDRGSVGERRAVVTAGVDDHEEHEPGQGEQERIALHGELLVCRRKKGKLCIKRSGLIAYNYSTKKGFCQGIFEQI